MLSGNGICNNWYLHQEDSHNFQLKRMFCCHSQSSPIALLHPNQFLQSYWQCAHSLGRSISSAQLGRIETNIDNRRYFQCSQAPIRFFVTCLERLTIYRKRHRDQNSKGCWPWHLTQTKRSSTWIRDRMIVFLLSDFPTDLRICII